MDFSYYVTMSDARLRPDPSTHIADTSAGAVRLVSLRLSHQQQNIVDKSEHFSKYVGNFLETEVRSPFRYKQVSPTAFAINGACSPPVFDDYAFSLHERLMQFLFGTERCDDCQILFFAGSDVEVARFITETDEEALARSKAYLKRISDEKTSKQSGDDKGIKRIRGKRPLFYRGILACPQRVLLAYAITPAADLPDQSGNLNRDINLARYLDFRGDEAMEFSKRIFDKASYLLQTSRADMQSMILAVPLRYRSLLSSQDRRAFLNNVADHPSWVRDQMFLSVSGAPPNPSSSTIQRFIGEFSTNFRTIDWQVYSADFDLNIFTGCRLHSITLDLDQVKTNREKVLAQFISRAADLRRLKIRPGVSGLENAKELIACLKNQIVYASGNAVTKPLPQPALAQKIDLRDLPIIEPTVLGSPVQSEAA